MDDPRVRPPYAVSAVGLAEDRGSRPAAPTLRPEDEEMLRRKALKRHLDATRPLDSWERYRALNDAMDEAYELIDIGNREARFALILMGGLNAVVLVAATRSDAVSMLSGQERVWVGALLALYALVAVHFLLQAIEALRPGRFRPRFHGWPEDSADYPMGARYFEDVVSRDAQDHWQVWSQVRIGQLNAELAIQLHSLCLKNSSKRTALRRLYAGLRIMTLLVAGLLVILVYAAWM